MNKITELKVINSKRFSDERGFFSEIYSRRKFLDYGISVEFVQDNHSLSKEVGTLRGLHFQRPPKAQAKLIKCVQGSIYDVAVDIRIGSPTYGIWEGFVLSANNGDQLYIPIGFAHGFVTLQPDTEIIYKCSDYYAPDMEGSIFWKDPDIRIDWPLSAKPILSSKDSVAPMLENVESPFIYGENS